MNTNWRTIYRWDIALIALFIFLFSFVRFPKSKEHNSIDFKHIAQIAFKGNLPWFYFAIACYVAAEIGLSSWLVTFLQELRSASVTSSTQALSLFFTMLMLGRLGGGFIVQRLGYLRAILFASVGALACLAAGTFTNFSVLLPITGLFFSIIFPLLTPVLVTAGILNLLGIWNEFLLPLYYLNRSTYWPMTLAVYNFFGQYQQDWSLVSADIVLTILPVIIIYLFAQRFILSGMTAGSVKG